MDEKVLRQSGSNSVGRGSMKSRVLLAIAAAAVVAGCSGEPSTTVETVTETATVTVTETVTETLTETATATVTVEATAAAEPTSTEEDGQEEEPAAAERTTPVVAEDDPNYDVYELLAANEGAEWYQQVRGATRDANLLEVETSITDPRGTSGSAEARAALEVCEAAVTYMEATGESEPTVRVLESDGSTFVVRAGVSGSNCTEA
ncbi:hypothetical protein ACI3EY_08115 [Ornithinimicrobium sp. LYQ92]|uniref:hypothetical protein n=1 Tax=Serinicoccus sp. LYQ92 TaxID=3378798 RepID=UPI00385267CE